MVMTEKTSKKTTAKKVTKEVAPKPVAKKVDTNKFAVIKTGGKQYVVYVGKKYDFEKLELEEGASVDFTEVLLVADGGEVKLGEPFVAGAKVSGKVASQFREEKIEVLKYKPKKHYRKLYGHRQAKTKVEITSIK
jgi:large subunit ribosomal protein L21